MSRPLKVDTTTTPTSLKEMSDADIDYTAHQILTEFAASNTGTGTLSIGGAVGTAIGNFVDTYRPYGVGDHPVGTNIVSVTYTLRQDLTANQAETHGSNRPVEFSTGGIREQTDTEIDTYIMTRTLSRLAADGLGSYKLQATAPTVGGTWISIGSIKDTREDGATTVVTSTLWRRSAQTAPTIVVPVKTNNKVMPVLDDAGVPTGAAYFQRVLREQTDYEIKKLIGRFRNKIVSTGIGKYLLQSAIPTGGTWIRAGQILYDTRADTANTSYTSNYTGNYTGSYIEGYYTGYFTGYFSGTYAGYAAANYTGSYTGAYKLTVNKTYTSNFVGPGAVYYGGSLRWVNTSYTGSFTGGYSTFWAGTYTGTYAGTAAANYTGAYSQAFSQAFTRSYAGEYTGTYSTSFTGLTVAATNTNISSVSLWLRTA
jgi:hypothetical protein